MQLLYLIDMRMPVLVMCGNGFFRINPREEGGMSQIYFVRVHSKVMANCVLNLRFYHLYQSCSKPYNTYLVFRSYLARFMDWKFKYIMRLGTNNNSKIKYLFFHRTWNTQQISCTGCVVECFNAYRINHEMRFVLQNELLTITM